MPTFSNSSTGRTGTIQTYTIPATGVYKFEAYGAAGGAGNGGVGGKGAYVYGQMNMTAGTQLSIIVGQAGTRASSNYEGGGGGGSFVYVTSTVDLIIAAGGGGGGSQNGPGANGVTGTSGTVGPQGGGTAGTNGSGGSGGYGASGAGWLTTGGTAGWSPTGQVRPGSACKPGATYDTSGAQATGGQGDSAYNPMGGFGGGAGAHGNSYIGGGGGGGYSGGAGSGSSGYGGGGGGSFLHSSLVGTGGTAGTQTGHGSVIITQINQSPNPPTLVSPVDGEYINLNINGGTFTWTHSDPEGNPQIGYIFRRVISGSTSYWSEFNQAFQATPEVLNFTSTQSVTFPPGVWPVSTTPYAWSVATADDYSTGTYSTANNVYSVVEATEDEILRWDTPARPVPAYTVDAIATTQLTGSYAVDSSIVKPFWIKLSAPAASSGNASAGSPNTSLGKYVSTTPLTNNSLHNLFDAITPVENRLLEAEYRCVFFHNAGGKDYVEVQAYVSGELSAGASIAIGLDPTAASSVGSSTAQAVQVADEDTAPAGVTFGTYDQPTNALALGAINIGQVKAVWIRRTNLNTPQMNDRADLNFEARYI